MTSWQAGLPVFGGDRCIAAWSRRDEDTLLAAIDCDVPRTGHLSPKGMR